MARGRGNFGDPRDASDFAHLQRSLALLFFVSPQYPELAQRIELGLQRARQSGAFDQIFEKEFGSTIRRLKLDERIMLELHNPDLPSRSRIMMADPSLIYAPVTATPSAQ